MNKIKKLYLDILMSNATKTEFDAEIPGYLIYDDDFTKIISQCKKLTKKLMIDFVESLREYERENHKLLGFDERETKELLKVFLKHKLKNIT